MIIECAYGRDNFFSRNHFLHPDKVNSFRFKYNNLDIYTSAYTYDIDLKATDKILEAKALGDLYLDFDADLSSEETFNIIRKDTKNAISYLCNVMCVQKKDIRIYFSGCKGIHLIVPSATMSIEPHENLNSIYKLIAKDISEIAQCNTLDLGIYDKRRLFRIPHSIHKKTKLYKIPITYTELESLPLHKIKNLAKKPRAMKYRTPEPSRIATQSFNSFIDKWRSVKPKSYNNSVVPIKNKPPCMQHILSNTTTKGQRNDTIAVLCSFFKQAGKPITDIESIISNWNKKYCDPPVENKELYTTIESVYKRGYKFGCSTLKDLSKCDHKKCSLFSSNK